MHAALDRLAPDLVEASSPWRGAWIAAGWPGPAARALFMHADPVFSYPQRWLGPLIGGERVDRVFDGFWRYLGRLSDRFDVTVAGSRWLAERLAAQGLRRGEGCSARRRPRRSSRPARRAAQSSGPSSCADAGCRPPRAC